MSNSSVLNRAATALTVNQLMFDFGRNDSLVQERTSSRAEIPSSRRPRAIRTANHLSRSTAPHFTTSCAPRPCSKSPEQTVAARQVVVDQTKELQKSGIKSGLDVSVADYSLAESKLLFVRAQNDLRAAAATLCAAIGSGDEHVFELADEPLPVVAVPIETDILAPAFAINPN